MLRFSDRFSFENKYFNLRPLIKVHQKIIFSEENKLKEDKNLGGSLKSKVTV